MKKNQLKIRAESKSDTSFIYLVIGSQIMPFYVIGVEKFKIQVVGVHDDDGDQENFDVITYLTSHTEICCTILLSTKNTKISTYQYKY